MTNADVDPEDIRLKQMQDAREKLKEFSYNSPPVAYVCSPNDKAKLLTIGISKSHLEKLGGRGRRQKFMSLWYNILGVIPPVPNIGFHGDITKDTDSTNVKNAHALIKGIDRPCCSNDNGDDVYCYVLKPEYTYEYIDHMVCAARKTSAPKNAVFLTYVRFFENYETLDEGNLTGEIISWDWVKSDPTAPNMPAGFQTKDLIWR